MDVRIERDTLGEVAVPADALWRAQTQRAVENFPVSGRGLEPAHIHALALIKSAAAAVNVELGILDAELGEAIVAAAEEVASGAHDDQFPIDTFQTGSGTSSNMNANEVIATLAQQRVTANVHPNDHVNASRSRALPRRRVALGTELPAGFGTRVPLARGGQRRWRRMASTRPVNSRARRMGTPRHGDMLVRSASSETTSSAPTSTARSSTRLSS